MAVGEPRRLDFEWVEDYWHSSYEGAPADGKAWARVDCGTQVMRGCAWFIDSARPREAYRNDANRPEDIIW
jgi:formylglycine-generating enzyme required for sulfatase activity